jgi:dTDP-4-amino-4,6-dideoxygalactose transaminase
VKQQHRTTDISTETGAVQSSRRHAVAFLSAHPDRCDFLRTACELSQAFTRFPLRACARRANRYNPFIIRGIPSRTRPLNRLPVPFVDLGPANGAVKRRVLERIGETIDRGDFTNGHAVEEFERELADHSGRRHCVAVSSGLDALRLSLVTSELAPDAGVIVPAMTFAATFEAVIQAGGTPLVVDVAEVDYNLDVVATEVAAAEGATHVLPVHLYGQMADMRGLSRVAERHGLQIVEDACQAHGARRDGVAAGSVGRAAAFSFYPAKNLGAMGDAGALVTDDEALAEHARALRVHGETGKYHHEYVGYTARLDTIQAIVLLEKLPLLEKWNRERRAAAQFYTDALAGLEHLGLRLPPEPTGSSSVWHLYVVRTSNPQQLAAFLADRGIQTGRHYPEPPHLAPAYRSLGFGPGDFPVAEALACEGLSLPVYPGISEAQLAHVCEAVQDYFGVGARRRTLVGTG